MLGAVRPPGNHDLFHHHRRAPLAGGRHTALAALAQLRAAAIRGALDGSITLPAAGPAGERAPGSDRGISDAELQIPLGDAPVPDRGGQPCPAGIAPIRLSIAETIRLTVLPGSTPPG